MACLADIQISLHDSGNTLVRRYLHPVCVSPHQGMDVLRRTIRQSWWGSQCREAPSSRGSRPTVVCRAVVLRRALFGYLEKESRCGWRLSKICWQYVGNKRNKTWHVWTFLWAWAQTWKGEIISEFTCGWETPGAVVTSIVGWVAQKPLLRMGMTPVRGGNFFFFSFPTWCSCRAVPL